MSIKVTSRVWDHSSQSSSSLLALLALADYADDYGVCYPGLDKIAYKARVDERQARRIMRNLEAGGELFTLPQSGQNGGRGYTNLYLVASGMTAYDIEEVLTKRFEIKPELAARIADYLIILQDGGNFEGETPPDPRLELVPNKGDIFTPLKSRRKKGDIQGRKGGHLRTKRGTSRAEKGGVQTPRIRHEPSIEPSMNPSEDAAPQKDKSKAKKAKPHSGKQNASSIPVAIELYREITQLYPPKSWWPKIVEAVGDQPDNLNFWRELILDWIGCGFRAAYIVGLLDCYGRRELPSTRHNKKGTKDHAKPKTDPTNKPNPADPDEWARMLRDVA